MDFEPDPHSAALLTRLEDFMAVHVFPAKAAVEHAMHSQPADFRQWQPVSASWRPDLGSGAQLALTAGYGLFETRLDTLRPNPANPKTR
jgi:hypothetical protein